MAKRRKSGESKLGVQRENARTEKAAPSPGNSRVKSPNLRRKVASKRRSPLEQAQELAWKAMQSPHPERQLELAERALKLSLDCTDAYIVVSRFVADGRQALVLLEQGFAAAERVLGPDAASRRAGSFWIDDETRPYLRVRLGLSECLWSLGRGDESVAHLLDILRLNPQDNQGVRYLLAAHLLDLGRDAEFDDLVKKYDEPSAFMLFSKLLREFRRTGDSPAARKLLAQARRSNKFVIPMLLDLAPADDGPPEMYAPGDRNEALLYLADFACGWKQTPGAITWLRNAVDAGRTAQAKPPVGPTETVKKQLAALPQDYSALWQAAVSRVPTWLRDGTRLVRPWSILIVDYSDHQILVQELVAQEPGPELLFDHLARAMRKPAAGKRRRPSEIQVRDDAVWSAVQPHLQEIGVDCIFRTDLEEADFILGEVQKMMQPEAQPPALVETANFNSAQGASFYAAAADYFHSTPWRRLPGDVVIQVDVPQLAEFSSGRWYAVVLGQLGRTMGLALYSDKGAIEQLCCGEECGSGSHDAANQAESTAISMLFSEGFEVPIADVLAAEQHHWELAGPEAYPMILCADPSDDVRQIEPWELQLLEGCVRTIPDFVKQHPYSSGSSTERAAVATASYTVRVVSSKLKFTLSWLEPDERHCGSGDGSESHCNENQCGDGHCNDACDRHAT